MAVTRYTIPGLDTGRWAIVLREGPGGTTELSARRLVDGGGSVTVRLQGLRLLSREGGAGRRALLQAEGMDIGLGCHRIRSPRAVGLALDEFLAWLGSDAPELVERSCAWRRPQRGVRG
jgi:hypothetical protein